MGKTFGHGAEIEDCYAAPSPLSRRGHPIAVTTWDIVAYDSFRNCVETSGNKRFQLHVPSRGHILTPGVLFLAAVAITGPVHAQFGSMGQYAPTSNPVVRGFQLQPVSAYVSRFWTDGANLRSVSPLFQASLGSDMLYGGGTGVSWAAPGPTSNFSATYNVSYNGSTRYSDFNRLNHNLTFSANRPFTLTRRWSVDVSGGAGLNTFETFFFQPTALGAVAGSGASFDDLAGAALSRSYSDANLGSALSGAGSPDSPLTPYFFGSRFLNLHLQLGLSWAYSPRLRIRFGLGGNRNQPLTETVRGTGGAPVLDSVAAQQTPHITSGQFSTTISYSLSPRSELTGTLAVNRAFVRGGGFYGSTAMLSLTRTLSRRLFTQVRGGSSQIHTGGGLPLPISRTPQWVAGGALGFRTYRNIFLVNADRAVAYSYGIPSTTMTVSGAWGWTDPRRVWSVMTDVSQERFRTGTDNHVTGWRLNVGGSRMLGNHFAISFGYAHAQYANMFGTTGSNDRFSMVRFGVSWIPFALRR